jgi:hypothetical protein
MMNVFEPLKVSQWAAMGLVVGIRGLGLGLLNESWFRKICQTTYRWQLALPESQSTAQ